MRPDDARRRVRDDGSVVITSQAGDLQGTANTAKNLTLQDVNGDWTMESKVVFSRALAANNEQGGIVAYADDQNYVKLAWEMSSVTQAINKLRVVFLREQGGTAQTFQVTGADAQKLVGAGGAIWLRIAKTGGTYKAYYSSDGAVWRYFATATLNVEPARAGLLAFNRGGTSTDLDVAFESFAVQSAGEVVPSLIAEAPGTVGGTVPATLSLTLGGAATFAPFVPGVAREYTAATTATVVSTAGDAALTVSDPGRLVNGAFSLPQPLSVAFSKAAWSGAGVERGGRRHVQAGDRRDRRTAHRHLLQDAHVHVVDDEPLNPRSRRWSYARRLCAKYAASAVARSASSRYPYPICGAGSSCSIVPSSHTRKYCSPAIRLFSSTSSATRPSITSIRPSNRWPNGPPLASRCT